VAIDRRRTGRHRREEAVAHVLAGRRGGREIHAVHQVAEQRVTARGPNNSPRLEPARCPSTARRTTTPIEVEATVRALDESTKPFVLRGTTVSHAVTPARVCGAITETRTGSRGVVKRVRSAKRPGLMANKLDIELSLVWPLRAFCGPPVPRAA
jgi:hypothetical protein